MGLVTSSPWPPPSDSPVGSSGWYLASDRQWYQTTTAPAPGYVLGRNGRWIDADDATPGDLDEAWRWSRWGLGDVWWGVLAYVGVSLAVGFVVIGLAAARGQDIDEFELGAYTLSVLVVGNVVAFFGVPWLASRRKGLRRLRDDFGLRIRPVDVAIGLGIGVAGLLAAGLVGTAIDAALGADETTSNIPIDRLDGAGEIVAFLVAVAVITPVVEELFFRGLVFRSLLKRGVPGIRAGVITTIVFVLPHLGSAGDWTSLLSLAGSITVLGFAFQIACHVTDNRLGAPIVAHMVINGTAAIVLAFG